LTVAGEPLDPVLGLQDGRMQDTVAQVYALLFGAGLVLAPAYLVLAAAVAWLVWRRQGIGGSFWGWLVPRRVWLHPSHLVDLQLFLVSRIFAAIGLIGALTLTTVVAASVAALIPSPIIAPAVLSPLALALILWLPTDFAAYWVHRIYHRWSVIWPLHAVHHSAEVMTPITTYRQHPLAMVVTTLAQSAIAGALQGLLIGSLTAGAEFATIAGINAFFVLANAGLAALHHSHVWLSYGPVLERIVISPAQHQIHHSRDPAHFNRNFGNSLALWDWMFGTLYVIRGPEDLHFGLDGAAERPLMSQDIKQILWDPLRRILRLG
jgi:sterol desaturase/sphingolipid hydroxylase (fatty acid hydroxylase superfamily)